ncbi:MAG: hypothetical protein AAFN16_09485 [Pseudomonadota bacterium]
MKIRLEIDLRNLPADTAEKQAFTKKAQQDINKAIATVLTQIGADGRIVNVATHMPKPVT